jgi:hypothetical protein
MKIKKWNGSAWVQEYPEVEVGSIVATGTPGSTTYLRGDGTWATIEAGGISKADLQNVYVYGKASGAITKGQAIQFAGAQGGHILIKTAVPAEINAEPTLMVGIAETDLANNEFGYVLVSGRLTLNTSAYNAGDLLYFASAGTVAGALTTTEPTDPNASIQMAVVSIDGIGNGEFLVRKTILSRHINEVLGLQGALDGKVAKAGDTMTGDLTFGNDSTGIQLYADNSLKKVAGTGIVMTTDSTRGLDILLQFERGTGGTKYKAFHDGYHPNADTWTTARTLTIGNTGKSVNGSGNVSWSLAELGAYAATNPSGYQTAAQVSTAISNLVDSSPATLDTLNELAAALGDDPNFATTMATALGGKMSTSHPANNITSTHLYMANGDGFIWNDTTNVMSVRKDGTDYVLFADDYHPNADTWTTARTLTIGNTGKSVNGSGNVSWSLAEIGAYAASNPSGYLTSSHTHNLLSYNLAPTSVVDSMTNTTFRTSMFGTSASGSQIATARWNTSPSVLGMSSYGTLIGWGASDTQGFLAVDYATNRAKVGGGSGNNISWIQELIHTGNIGSQSVNYATSAGNADTVDGFHASQTAGSANTAVVRNSSGYIMNTWFNSNRGNETSAAASYIYDTGDGYMRKKTLANARSEIVTSSAVTTALGYTPYNSTNPSGYITSTASISGGSQFLGTERGTPDNALQYWQASGLGTTEAPNGDWHNTIRMSHGDPLSYYSNTLAIRMTGVGVGDIYTQTIMNGSAQGWKKHWNDGNDGSGSGLSADNVDGYHIVVGSTGSDASTLYFVT